jgi:hypothetical protein
MVAAGFTGSRSPAGSACQQPGGCFADRDRLAGLRDRRDGCAAGAARVVVLG